MKEMTPAEIEKVRGHFDYFDEDGSGRIDIKEFRRLFKVLAPDSTRAEADAGYEAIDTDGNGDIDFDEFLDWWKSNWLVF